MSPEPQALDLSKVVWPDVMDLQTAALYVGVSAQYARQLAKKGDLKGTKGEGNQWAFKKSDLDVFKNTPRKRGGGGGGRRGDGKLYQIRVKYEHLEKVKTALGQFDIELEPRYKYQGKKDKKAAPKPGQPSQATPSPTAHK